MFLLIEGRNTFGEAIFCKLEMVLDETKKSRKIDIPKRGPQVIVGYGHILIKQCCVPFIEREKTLLGNDFLKGDSICGRTWNISKEIVRQLIGLAKKDQAKENTDEQLRYFIAGEKSLFTSLSPEARKGYSCFTWALKLLKELKCPSITIGFNYRAYANPCKYLPAPQPNNKKSCLMM